MEKITLKDYEDIIKTVKLYTEGGNKNSSIMKPAFHEKAIINGEPIQTLFDAVDKAGETNAQTRIDVLDVVNDIAVVRVVMENWHGSNYVDFHQLMKTENGWKIISKVFTEVK